MLYLVLKTITRFENCEKEGYVLNPSYFSVINDRLSEATDKDLSEVKNEIKKELTEGDYLEDKNFMEKMEAVFSQTDIFDYKNSVLFTIIKECVEEVNS